jgi:hypothetical protein
MQVAMRLVRLERLQEFQLFPYSLSLVVAGAVMMAAVAAVAAVFCITINSNFPKTLIIQ